MAARLEPERFAKIVAAHADEHTTPASSLCVAGVEVLSVTGAGLVLMSGGRSLDFVGVSDPVSEAVEQMEYTLGEGPCVPRLPNQGPGLRRRPGRRRNRPVAGVPAGCARAVGVRAAFGFPLLIDRVCIGALNLYHDRSGALSDDQVADALVVGEVREPRPCMAWQADAPPGAVAWQLEQVPNHRVEVHQATGRISVQLGYLARRCARAVARVRLLARPSDRRRRRRVAAGRLRLD